LKAKREESNRAKVRGLKVGKGRKRERAEQQQKERETRAESE